MENFCIYLRKSRADQEAEARGEMETLARHEKILLELAKRQHLHIGAIYKEVVSGETISARPVMQKLLSEVEAGLWDGVLVVEIERLARGDTIDQGVVSRAFQFTGTRIITPTKTYDPNNEFDEEYFEFGLFMSRREYKTIKRRLNAGRLSSVKEGKYVGNKPPYGYERIKLKREKGYTLAPVPDQAIVVRMIYDWYVNGTDGERIGVSKIVRKLNNLKIPAMNRETWVPASVSGILSNPVYIGKVVWNRRKAVKQMIDGNVVVSRPRSEDYDLCDGLHPAIIDQDIWEKAQQIRSKNPPRPQNTLHSIMNPLSGLVVCGKCGRKMIRRPYTGRKQKDTLMCPYTECSTVSSCLYLVENAVIQSIEDMVAKYKADPEVFQKDSDTVIQSLESVITQHKAALQKLNDQKNRMYDLLEQGLYTTDVFLDRSSNLAKQIDGTTEAIKKAEAELEDEKNRKYNQYKLIPRCEDLLENYASWDVATKNDVLKELIEKIVYTKDTKNAFKKGDIPTFKLKIYPKIP